MLTHGSLFSGIGGFNLGAQWAGIETVWDCEILPYNRQILKQHFPNSIQYEDITKLQYPSQVDIVSGGFPCQDISISGNMEGINGSRSGLWFEMFRIIRDIRPKYVVIENSPMLLVRGFEQVLCNLSYVGYDAEWQVLSARDFGYPHRRDRLFCVAYANSKCSQTLFQRHTEIAGLREKSESAEVYSLYQSVEWLDGQTNYRPIGRGDGVPNIVMEIQD